MSSRTLLSISLGVNLFLGMAVFYMVVFQPSGGGREARFASGGGTNGEFASGATNTVIMVVFTNSVAMDWHNADAPEYKRYVLNLRAVGCSDETVSNIVTGDLNKLFDSRQKELVGGGEEFKYWKPEQTAFGTFDPDKIKQRRGLAGAKRTLLNELLGLEIEENAAMAEAFSPVNDLREVLSKEKQQRVSELEAAYANKTVELLGNKGSNLSPEDLENYRKLQTEKSAELAKFLTEPELEECELRISATAQSMRSTLGDFEATEQEFRSIFRARKVFEQQFPLPSTGEEDIASRDRRTAAELELARKLKASLGEVRFTQYDHERLWNQDNLRSVTATYNLPKDTIFKAFDVNRGALEETFRVRSNPSLSRDIQQQQLARLRKQVEAGLNDMLGEAAFTAYRQTGAKWLEQISPSGSAKN